eukprot:GHRR01020328.1.p1 GENE.GHRR01020328.1~~GHRR01020328.1.p1  ORF type:complete len:1679 (+),score=578.13 GHRR01020328.1:143-5179(+)
MDQVIQDGLEDQDVVTVAVDPVCLGWIQDKLRLLLYGPSSDWQAWLDKAWQPAAHEQPIAAFLTRLKVCRLLAITYKPDDVNFTMMHELPPKFYRMVYFIKDPTKFITRSNIAQVVQFGVLKAGYLARAVSSASADDAKAPSSDGANDGTAGSMEALLRLVGSVYLPQVINSGSWPDAVRKEFLAYTHRFMANLTEAVHEAQGRTVLYMPAEELAGLSISKAAWDKHLTRRLETTLIYWTRQITNVLNRQDCSDSGQQAGPLVEIEFWRSRSLDLSGIRAQLEGRQVADMVAVLSLAGSSYLAPFLQLKELIQHEAVAAQDNVRFLTCLEEPCKQLSKACPLEIPGLLPQILDRIRMIWCLSRFYNIPERITSLLKRLSNEVINRCSAALRLGDIFTGDVSGPMDILQQSMAAGAAWKSCYERTAAAVGRHCPRPWDFDMGSLYSYIDAFLQRCRDLLEVCEAQLQFAPSTKLPVFSGTRGPEVERNIADIQVAFQGLVKQLKGLKYDILDIKAIQWYDDFNVFKVGVRDLEVMLENVLELALDTAPSLQGTLELLEGFQLIAKRDAVKRAVQKHVSVFYGKFMGEINAAKKHFDLLRRCPPGSPLLPKYAGAARAAATLLRRLEQTHGVLIAVKPMLPSVPEEADALTAYELTHQSMQQFIVNTHTEWFNTIDNSISKQLQDNLLTQDKADRGLLSMNFNPQLLAMSQEVVHWERLRMAVPYIAMEIQAQREKYRVLRDNMLMVVREYNKVLVALDAEERKLFFDRIRALDRRILPGVSKLNWVADKHALEFYYKEARKHCRIADCSVCEFKTGMTKIDTLCKGIAEGLLINVEKKRLYDHTEFEAVQATHHDMAKKRLIAAHAEIKKTLAEVYTHFEADGEDVQREWVKFTVKVDKKVEDALRHTVKRSLHELSRLLTGDSKTEVLPIFRVTLILERNQHVELRPTIQQLFDMTQKVCRDLVTVVQVVARLAQQATPRQLKELEDRGEPPPSHPQTYHQLISSDEEVTLKTIVQISTGITSVVDPVQACLEHFEKRYKKLWDQDKDAYIRRYEKAQKPLSSYEADVTEYMNKAAEIQMEETTANIKFLFVDCGPLKQTLNMHCELWKAKLTNLLNNLAAAELRNLHEYFRNGLEALSKAPQNLEQLAESVGLHRRLVNEKAKTAASFEPLRDKYRMLERFEVQVPDAQLEQLDKLDLAWARFQVGLDEAAARLERSKDAFRDKVKAMLEAFVRDIATMQEEFVRGAPYDAETTTSRQALAFVTRWNNATTSARHKATEIKSGMDIFSIPQPPYKELVQIEKELELLDKMWSLVAEWEGTYSGWKDGLFKDLKVVEMEETAARFSKQVTKLGRDVKNWLLWGWFRDKIDAFKKTMPLITDLRNPAMRQRHWQQLMEHIGTSFDPADTNFTLETVMALRLDQHAEFIAELSVNATKELAIETSLAAISATWADLGLDLTEYKGAYKLRSTEDIFAALEDNSVTLSSMKASRYYLVFEGPVAHWEQTLSLVSETIEIILQVQRNWMYLENIFIGSEDIRKQLPQESLMFEGVHRTFIRSMQRLHAKSNVVQATTAAGVLTAFQDMDAKLEKVQKSLENYLESKRQQFPRFYFLSSDDLLEILGQARDPQNVQAHLKKCFEGGSAWFMLLCLCRSLHTFIAVSVPLLIVLLSTSPAKSIK